MKKLLLSLTLLLIATCFPNKAKAWDFSQTTDPWKIELVFDATTMPVFDGEAEPAMTFDETESAWKSVEFTATTTDILFQTRLYNGTEESYNSFLFGNGEYTATPSSDWIIAKSEGGTADDYWYKLSGLSIGTNYRIEFTENETIDDEYFQYRVVEIPEEVIYLYTLGTSETEEVTYLAEATNENGIFTFNMDIERDTYLFLSRNAGATTWDEMQEDYGRWSPDGIDVTLPTHNSGFVNNNTSGAWFVPNTGRYTLTVDLASKTLSAVNDIYIYSSLNNWTTQKAQANPTEYGKYTFTIDLNAYEYIVLSDKSESNFSIRSLNWTPGTDVEIKSNETTTFGQNTSGAWYATKAGKYAISVDWMNEPHTFNVFEISVYMPLTSADFAADGSKKHYFLVGERNGEWHLQPEWKFKEVNGELILNNRYIYNGAFAVGVVDNYEDYIHHTFTYYCNAQDFTTDVTSSTTDISTTARVFQQGKGKTRFNPSNVFYAKFDGEDSYYEGAGTFMSEIKVSLNDNNLPFAISFTKGSPEEASRQRVFTLVGDNIINRNFSNTSGNGHTTMYNRGYSGWFDSWIQYDPATNRPYVDANGEYLYHTSFTPDYLTANPVQFNLELSDGSEFAYTSGQVQFVEWSKLPNLASDPYKDFYQAFSGQEKIWDSGEQKVGEGYNFKVKVECDNLETTPTADWSCYVVRDLWIGGQIKFWSGWGGNEDATNNGTEHLAVWHGPNGGPDITADTNHDVKGYDVNAGLSAVLYKNVARRGNTNYKISDGKPVYFNRVVLWFNNSDGVDNSYIQFIQESAGPAIFAQPTVNESTGKKNYITYNWYLNESQNESDKTAKVVSYEIRRYRVVDGIPQSAGYPEGEIVDISDSELTIEDLYEDNAVNHPEITTHVDMGILDNRGFAPGLYQYDIYVTDEFGGRKLAVSNRVAIYDDELVTPDAVAMQLVELRDEYTDIYDVHHDGATTVLAEALKSAGLDADIVAGKKYLTYRANDNDIFYLMENITDGATNIPVGVEIIDSKVALEFLNNNPDKYWWTSDYYLRCLDYNSYSSILQGYIDNGMITETEIPEPVLEVFDVITPEDGSSSVRQSRGNAYRFDLGDKSYYSTIVKRGGNLADATFDVTLTYSYHPSSADEAVSPTTHAATTINPVVPQPFAPVYRYVYERQSRNLDDQFQWGKIKVPVNNKDNATTSDAILNNDIDYAYVRLDDGNFAPRSLTLQIDFNRPNVNDEIYRYYDINYQVNLVNADTDLATELTVPLNINTVLQDSETADAHAATPNRYRIEFKGLHPRNGVYPTVSFAKTEYEPNATVAALDGGDLYKSRTANFGNTLAIDAVRTIEATENLDGLNKVHLGKIKRDDNKWDWMYKGHESFFDNNPTFIETSSLYEDADAYAFDSEFFLPIEPLYYLIELKNNEEETATYKYLVPHIAGHNSGSSIEVDPDNGLILNDADPLIGSYISEDFTYDDTPTIYMTSIYIFERPLYVTTTNVYENYINLDLLSLKVNDTEIASTAANNAPAARVREVTDDEFVATGAGEMPNASDDVPADVLDMSAPDATTGYNSYIAVKGVTYTDNTGGVVTGVENLLADEDNADTIYYNLQGIRIDKPTAAGIYLRANGNKVSKFIIR